MALVATIAPRSLAPTALDNYDAKERQDDEKANCSEDGHARAAHDLFFLFGLVNGVKHHCFTLRGCCFLSSDEICILWLVEVTFDELIYCELRRSEPFDDTILATLHKICGNFHCDFFSHELRLRLLF